MPKVGGRHGWIFRLSLPGKSSGFPLNPQEVIHFLQRGRRDRGKGGGFLPCDSIEENAISQATEALETAEVDFADLQAPLNLQTPLRCACAEAGSGSGGEAKGRGRVGGGSIGRGRGGLGCLGNLYIFDIYTLRHRIYVS